MKLTKKKLDKLEVLIDLLDDMVCLDSTTINDLEMAIRIARRELKSDLLHLVSKSFKCCKELDKCSVQCDDCNMVYNY